MGEITPDNREREAAPAKAFEWQTFVGERAVSGSVDYIPLDDEETGAANRVRRKNGRRPFYFDKLYGQVILGKEALNLHLEAGGHPADTQDLEEILLAKKAPEGRFTPAETGISFNQAPLDVIAENGRWLYTLAKEARDRSDGRTKDVNHHIVSAVARLGFGPGIHAFYERDDIDGLDDLYKALEFKHIHRMNQEWNRDELVRHLGIVGAKLRRRPFEKDLVRLWKQNPHLHPHPEIYQREFGTFGQALEESGFVAPKAKHWTPATYLDWGVKFRIVNNGLPSSYRFLRKFSKRGYGPSESACIENFGSVADFLDSTEKEYEKYVEKREKLIEEMKTDLDRRDSLFALFSPAKTLDDLICLYSKYRLASELDPSAGPAKWSGLAAMDTSEMLAFLEGKNKGVDQETIKEYARHRGYFYFVWPPAKTHMQLRVPDRPKTKPVSASSFLSTKPQWKEKRKLAVERLHKKTEPGEETKKIEIAKKIQSALDNGEIRPNLFRGAGSANDIVRRFAAFKILQEMLPDEISPEELERLSVSGASQSRIVEILNKSGLDLPGQMVRELVATSPYFPALSPSSS